MGVNLQCGVKQEVVLPLNDTFRLSFSETKMKEFIKYFIGHKGDFHHGFTAFECICGKFKREAKSWKCSIVRLYRFVFVCRLSITHKHRINNIFIPHSREGYIFWITPSTLIWAQSPWVDVALGVQGVQGYVERSIENRRLKTDKGWSRKMPLPSHVATYWSQHDNLLCPHSRHDVVSTGPCGTVMVVSVLFGLVMNLEPLLRGCGGRWMRLLRPQSRRRRAISRTFIFQWILAKVNMTHQLRSLRCQLFFRECHPLTALDTHALYTQIL